jgi:oligopeptide/dipeptide ABC transporter ATP-binding protein
VNEPLLAVENLTVSLADGAPLVQDLALTIDRGETLAMVGESGCGKSMTALALMGLLPAGIRVTNGHVRYAGLDLVSLPERQLRDLRGNRIAMIFQEPMTSLNPVLRVGEQIEEVILRHERGSAGAARKRAADLLARVQVPDPEQRLRAFPHQLSGGQRQRVMIAAALACGPDLLIADEPTTALDVTTQAEILRLLRDLQRSSGLALLLITHDLGVVGQMADRVMVMYAGRKVEDGPTEAVLRNARHPYTKLLLAARPHAGTTRVDRLAEIPGIVPAPHALPAGCAFAPRCPKAAPPCRAAPPPLRDLSIDHRAACVYADAG